MVILYPSGSLPEYHAVVDLEAFDAIIYRLYAISGCKNHFELSAFLNTAPANISGAKRNLQLPVSWLRTAFLRCYANPIWIMNGEEPSTLYEVYRMGIHSVLLEAGDDFCMVCGAESKENSPY